MTVEKVAMAEKCNVCNVAVEASGAGITCDRCSGVLCSKQHLRTHLGKTGQRCLPYRVCRDDRRGRHLIATREIEPLELVLHDDPAVVGPATRTPPVCLGCMKILDKSRSESCSGCSFPMCSKDCSNSDSHKEECKLIRSFDTRQLAFGQENLVYASIFLLRVHLLKSRDEFKFKVVQSLLPGNTGDIATELVDGCHDILCNVFSGCAMSKDNVRSLMGIKRTNAVNMSHAEKKGNLLFPNYPLINSHCLCNTFCCVSTKDNSIEVRAQRRIHPGEEITTRYVSALEYQPVRQNSIWKNWKFICDCKRCSDVTEFGTFFSALRCTACFSYSVLPTDPQMLASPWACKECGTRVGNRDVESILKACEDAVKKHEAASDDDLLAQLEKFVSPKHGLVFVVKEKALLRSRTSDILRSETEVSKRISLAEELIRVLDKIDPGPTMRRGRILKALGKDRLALARLIPDEAGKKKETGRAVADLSEMARCIKYHV